MCGIVGVFNLNEEPVCKATLHSMTESLSHRGPDGEGLFFESNLGLGHRRLAILDLSSAGKQPMSTVDSELTISYNGEIYNYQEIRKELSALGYQFASNTDTEVILYAYREWGEACLSKFNGMFAFALWDRRKKEIFLARDRYGIKPLYYTFSNQTFIFASEQKAILLHPLVNKKMDIAAVLEYFTFQNLFTNKTFVDGIHVFPAGCWAKITTQSNYRLNCVRYWDFCFETPSKPLADREYEEELDRLIKQAVNRQLISDVPVGAYLSGGIDSGAMTAIASQHLPYIKTFTCGFDLRSASGLELAFDEREKAEYMSYLFKTEHYEMVLKAGDMERVLPRIAYQLEEPRVGQSYPNYYIAQLASKFVKVALSGSGGDELFGGYPWRYYRALQSENFEDYIDKYYFFWQRLIPNREIKEVFQPVWHQVQHVWTRDIFRDVFQQPIKQISSPEDYINHSLYFECKTFLHGLLIVEDKLSMAHGLETRVPFLDNDLVDFAMKLPAHLRLKNLAQSLEMNENDVAGKRNLTYSRTNDGKVLLRKVMESYIPPTIYNGVKQGFSAPDASWFRGESIDYVKKVIFNDDAPMYQILNKKAVRKLVDLHITGTENKRLFIWSLLNFNEICENFG